MNLARSCASLIMLSLAGCGGGGSDSPPPSANEAPTISGAPAAQADEDVLYSFTPDAADADGDALTFSIENAPRWAAFDAGTGTLSGTPARADVGGYDDVRISVSDGQDTTDLAAFAIEVVQVSRLTLAGVVTDQPIANAAVTLTAGGSEVEVDADDAGNYTAPLVLRAGDFDPDTLLTITARGTDAQSQVELITQVGSLGDLIEAAGDDETLAGEDDGRLNVTHVSTARYLLAIDNNEGGVPADAEALRSAEAAIDSAKLLDTAAIVKLVVDAGVIAVPEGETTLSLFVSNSEDVSNQDNIDSMLAGAGLLDDAGAFTPEFQEQLDAAITDTLADGAVLGRLTPGMLAGSTIWTTPMHPGWVPNGSAVLDFAEDGSGVSYEKAINAVAGFGGYSLVDASAAFTWTIDDGTLRIAYADYRTPLEFNLAQELVTTYGFEQSVADFILAEYNAGHLPPTNQYPLTRRDETRSVSLISSVPGHGAAPGLAQVRSTVEIEYDIDDLLATLPWQGELPRGHGSQTFDQVMYLPPIPNALADAPPAAGDSWAVPVIYAPVDDQLAIPATESLYPDLFTLEAGGTTSAGFVGRLSFDWSVAPEGLVLESGNERYVYTPVETDGYVYFGLVSHYVEGTLEFRYAQWIARADDSGAQLADDLVQDLPLYWQAGINAAAQGFYRDDGMLDPIWVFGYSFHDDGTSERINGDPSGTCLEVDTASCFTRDPTVFLTTIDGDSIVRDRLTPYQEMRAWKVLSYTPGGRAVLLEWQRSDYFMDGSWQITIPPRLNTLELTDLRDWSEEYAHSTL